MNKIRIAGIVDDDPIVIFGMKLMLKQVDADLQTHVWNNGQEAIEGLKALVENGKPLPDVIFLDLTMPIMDGWDFLDALQKATLPGKEKMRIFVLSSSINPVDRERALENKEVIDFIVKPLKEARLKEILSLAS
ncbi:Response regulator receiver domain-containing protein [Muriicola jejuensis]|uniref:Response regulator n=1 Tax=Muriicola jejuensis TaxID=504488 RepID=A0A6P0UE13_9FLAO|nr:response regulator [Muriicola jejuensis]NER09968.1 response regulator [Muriicola jejuensis]SMP04329.1 Response regulator receiver domain-containing protein [Muriicola jejuensis]